MQNKLLTIGETAKLLDVSIDTLRRWDKTGRFKAVRKTTAGDRYYQPEDVAAYLGDYFSLAKLWTQDNTAKELEGDYYCATRDAFKARLQRLESELGKIPDLRQIYPLISAITGEIGDNSFAHNLGNWPDIIGIFFAYDLEKRQVILADRGQGVFATLKRVRPGIKSDAEAVKMAFTEIISGREPEARGNGLKFVREVVISNDFRLFFKSGDSELILGPGDKNLNIRKADIAIRGCLAQIKF
ncbi:MAG: helix-turn-helix domain-containing protein [Patescibacteria group bacterium]